MDSISLPPLGLKYPSLYPSASVGDVNSHQAILISPTVELSDQLLQPTISILLHQQTVAGSRVLIGNILTNPQEKEGSFNAF